MKNYILKLLGIPNFKKEIADLKITIETLKNEATKTYKIYEDAFCFIKGIDMKDENKPWWEQDSLRYSDNHETMILVENIKRSKEIEFATNNPSLKVKKIFHGGCLSCKTPEEKGIGTCTGCRYLMGWNYPDLSIKKQKPY